MSNRNPPVESSPGLKNLVVLTATSDWESSALASQPQPRLPINQQALKVSGGRFNKVLCVTVKLAGIRYTHAPKLHSHPGPPLCWYVIG